MRSRVLFIFCSIFAVACSPRPAVAGKAADHLVITAPGTAWERSDEPDGSAVLTIRNSTLAEGSIKVTVYPEETDVKKAAKAEASRLRAQGGLWVSDVSSFESDGVLRARVIFGTSNAGKDALDGISLALPMPGAAKGVVVVTGSGRDERGGSLVILATGVVIQALQPMR